MRSVKDSPLPGDLIIRAEEERGLARHVTFQVTVWPDNDLAWGPYQSYGYAARQARALAARRQVHVWRELAVDGGGTGWRDVTVED
jgi:hypothetical protein